MSFYEGDVSLDLRTFVWRCIEDWAFARHHEVTTLLEAGALTLDYELPPPRNYGPSDDFHSPSSSAALFGFDLIRRTEY